MDGYSRAAVVPLERKPPRKEGKLEILQAAGKRKKVTIHLGGTHGELQTRTGELTEENERLYSRIEDKKERRTWTSGCAKQKGGR